MTSRRKKRRIDGGFIQVTRQLTRSAACGSLSSRAGWLLFALMDRYMGEDNRIAMSHRDAAAWLQTGLHQVKAAFVELEAKGFIRCTELGSFKMKIPHATIWTLTMFGRGGQKATLDFLQWRPPAPENESPETGRHIGNSTVAGVATAAPHTDAGAATDSPHDGCRGGNSADAGTATLIQGTILGSPPNGSASGGPSDPKRRRNRARAPMPKRVTERLQAAIAAKGWTQRELAELASTHGPIVSQIARGKLAHVGGETAARVLRVAEGSEPRGAGKFRRAETDA